MLEVRGLTKHFPGRRPVGGWRSHGLGQGRRRRSTSRSGPARRSGWSASRGCGKTTTTKLLLLLERPTDGSITLRRPGRLAAARARICCSYRRAVQAVFQDPYSSLSPRMRVGDIIAEPLEAQGGHSTADDPRAGQRGAGAGRA